MARAKCKYCNEWINTSTAYKDIIEGKNIYCCSENHFQLYQHQTIEKAAIQDEYNQIFELTKQIFGYEFTGYSLLKREINTWEKVGTRAKIIAYLTENMDWLSNVMSKEFASDFNRVRYYSVIVAGKLHDFKPKQAEAEKPKVVVDETIYEAPTQSLNKRRSLADLEDMF